MSLWRWLRRLMRSGESPPQPSAPEPRPGTPQTQRSDVRLDLSTGKFTPLAHSDVRQQAKKLGNIWQDPFLGRRDLIPPASDDRAALIDRAMVGQGLITQEELADIHEVGDEMDRVRPHIAGAHTKAAQSVKEDAAARAARKAQKKAEAAQRRRQRQEAIARRRGTDIVFLGRGVSHGLADRRANVERLEANGLPVLATPADVAKALDIAIGQLRWLAFHSVASTTRHYIRFDVPKKSGGVRTLAAPNAHLKRCQQWIRRHVLEKAAVHPAAQGFVRGRSTVTNAAPHVESRVVVNADLRDFFPTITFPRVRGILKGLGYSPAAATVLALICTEAPRREVTTGGVTYYVAAGPRALPQGACTSPALSNLVARRLDARLTGMATKLDFVYTRYADDLTCSSRREDAGRLVGYLLARLRHVCEDEGFTVNESKTRVLRRHRAQVVTGIVVNDRPTVSRKTVRRLRAILHQAEREGLAAQNRDQRPNFEAWLRGQVAYVSMVDPVRGGSLRAALSRVVD